MCEVVSLRKRRGYQHFHTTFRARRALTAACLALGAAAGKEFIVSRERWRISA